MTTFSKFANNWVNRIWRENLTFHLLVPGHDKRINLIDKIQSNHKLLLLQLIKDDESEIRYYFRQGKLVCQFDILQLVNYFKNKALPIKIIENLKSGEDTCNGLIFESIVSHLKGDDEKAAIYLESAEKEAENAISKYYMYLKLAECYSSVIKNVHETKKCLYKAESYADSSYCYNQIAKGWIKFLNNKQMAKGFVNQAENTAKTSTDLESLSETYLHLFGDNNIMLRVEVMFCL